MKTLYLSLPAFVLYTMTSVQAFAQTSANAPSAEPSPTAPTTTSDTPPPPTRPEQPADHTVELAPELPQSPPATSQPPPRFAPPPDSRWMPTPAPIWWGKAFDPPTPVVKRWYGWQTIIVTSGADALTLGSFMVLNSAPGAVALGLGMAAHVFGGPIVHWTHGFAGRGFAVLGMNLTFTAIGMLSTALVDGDAYLLPAVVGYIAGPILDITLFSTEINKPPSAMTSLGSPASSVTFGILPMVDSTRRGLLLTGQF